MFFLKRKTVLICTLIVLLGEGTAFLGVALIKAVPIAMNKAEVCVGTVCDMESYRLPADFD